eukprot:CAMPEP_0181137158 /NCGR_PEP_ID=MMETSP1071-20121207/33563_1 /TAXON_ID=35127 /ORGANISM="Thalassiosira sp., Strain NH16" /LENGTH=209 /DNA_ID=CAMNT_0023223907 /DNA_START=544 /DNA_END=1173 /DNA_ORIENTATION=-
MKPILLLLGSIVGAQSQTCKEVTTVENFDINAYASAKWYIQQQAVTAYQSESRNYCVSAEYTVKDRPSPVFGYTVGVHNRDGDANGNMRDGNICAVSDPNTPSKLKVAPCFLPQSLAGPYWVVAYDETSGYALVSGGQPTEVGENGGCRTGAGVNNSGLWIFTRSQQRDEGLIDEVRNIAEDAGFDLSVLNDVDQSNCDEQGFTSYLRN